jgi:hypothetical protein
MDAVLAQCAVEMHETLDITALEALRAIYDLLEADLRPSLDLLAGLLGHEPDDCAAVVTQLRRAGLVQRDRLGPTMVGLAVALGLPPTEPVAMRTAVVLVNAA